MTEITVRGSFSTARPPERATVVATISYEGSSMEPVYERVARDLEAVKASIAPLADSGSGAVTWWSADQLRTWSNRPWHKDGKQLPLIHHVSVGVKVEFADFTALSAWVGDHVATTQGFRVATIEWSLTDEHREEVLLEVRSRAVQDATTRAQQYADALNLGVIRPVALADAGMLGGSAGPAGGAPGFATRAFAAQGGAAPDIELMPQEIELSADVDARFVAGSPGTRSV